MTTLIFDPDVSGHHLDYLSFLVDFLLGKSSETQQKYIFVVSHKAKNRFSYASTTLRFHFLEQELLENLEQKSPLFERATAQFDLLEDLAKTYNASHVIFMFLDYMQLEIGKSKRRHNDLKLLGIFFQPFRKQFEDASTFKARLKRGIKGLRKSLQLRWMLNNKNLQTLYILNDNQAVEEFNQRYGNRFKFLPDPAPNLAPKVALEDIENLKVKYGIVSSKKVLLIFGSLSSKKNIENVVEALKLLDKTEQQQVTLYICGNPDDDYSVVLNNLLEETAKTLPNISIVTNLSFVSPATITEIFSMSTLVLSPYIHFYNSSGVVALAAKYNVPIVVSKSSIAGDITLKYGLGKVVNPFRPDEIAECISYFIKNDPLLDGSKYLNDFSSDIFCRKLLQLQ